MSALAIRSSENKLRDNLCYKTLPLESPFAWKSTSYALKKSIQFFPKGSNSTISFTAKRKSKIHGYIPFYGSYIGVLRIRDAAREHTLFKSTHLHALSKRSAKWLVRGVLETIPVLGGMICTIVDLIATLLSKNQSNLKRFADETACGYCHSCGFCRCEENIPLVQK